MKITNFFFNILRLGFITVISVVLASCTKGQNMLYIGNTLSDDFLGKLESELSMTSSGSFTKLHKIKSDNIEYKIAVDTNNKIVYIETKDNNFKTDEGIKIGTSLENVLELTSFNMLEEKGWAFYLPLNSGWNAAFVVGESMTNKKPDNDSKVKWFFKK